ncbi:hypothetical protein Ae201684P_011786 [Aphanomyces euteiches]|nr:hypothetical protein Ae201684P_011786 [Aphanomyces euteiches]
MLDEMKGMLCKAAVQSKNQELVNRMESAYVFRVTFGNDPAYDGSLLDSNNPEFDISYRMIYQLAKLGIVWDVFVSTLTNFTSLELRIKQVMVILAKLEEISNVEDMSVILCVDDLQKLTNNGTMNCAFYRVLASVCKFLNSSTVFAVCVCSATIQSPVELALSDPRQKCVFLVPPVLRGNRVLKSTTRLEKQLVDDMGGHGRALETLQEVLSRYEKEKLKRIDPGFIVDEVYDELQLQYGGSFFSKFLEEPLQCQDILAAILSRRRYNLDETVGKTGMTIDRLRSFGLFQWTHEGYLECAFIVLVILMRRLPKELGEVDNFNEHITRSGLVWQRFEQFVAFYRRVKSIAYCQIPVELSTFHAGARFGSVNGVDIEELHPRRVVEAVHRHNTKSGAKDSMILTDRHGHIDMSKMNTIVINGAGAPAGDIFMRVQLMIDGQQVQRRNVCQRAGKKP